MPYHTIDTAYVRSAMGGNSAQRSRVRRRLPTARPPINRAIGTEHPAKPRPNQSTRTSLMHRRRVLEQRAKTEPPKTDISRQRFRMRARAGIPSTKTNSLMAQRRAKIMGRGRRGIHLPPSMPPLVKASSVTNAQGVFMWPDMFKHTYAISIRNPRFVAMRKRFGAWADKIKKWPGTNGTHLNKAAYKKRRKLTNMRLKRGQIGCYDSHYRLWQHAVQNAFPYVFILEDDANIPYGAHMAQRIHTALQTLAKHNIQWDIFYLGRNRPDNNRRTLAPGLSVPFGVQGGIAYVLSLAGARKLVQQALPMTEPVDVYMAHMQGQGRLRAVAMHPRLCYVVPVHSDTRGIV